MTSDAKTISFRESGKFSSLFLDYTEGHSAVKDLFRFAPDPDGYGMAVSEFHYEETKRKLVADLVRRQYGSCEVPKELIDKFSLPGTATVTTGHQLCIFTGPLYFIYKILSTIRLAGEIEKQTGKPVVPVYWMASEDHDFAEIASVHLYGKTLTWKNPVKGPVGRFGVVSMQDMLREVVTLTGIGEEADRLNKIFAEAYDPTLQLADAMRLLVHKLFAGKILVVDPDEKELKRLFLPHMREDLYEHTAFKEVNATIALLKSRGYEAQVNPREINLFYLGVNFRERIVFENETWSVVSTDIAFTRDELEKELEDHPERFSPNVVLRPLYQQVVLPNLAYVGGPGELAYWLEYKNFFEKSGVPFPLLQPRHSVLLIDQNTAERIKKLGLKAADFFQPEDALVKQFIERQAGEEISLESEKQALRELFVNVVAKAKALDPTLEKSAEAEMQKITNGLDNLQSKMLRAKKQREESSVNQIRRIYAKLFPEGELQERFENFIPHYIHSGGELMRMPEEQFTFPVSGITIVNLH
jgi:bacillithiol synthase